MIETTQKSVKTKLQNFVKEWVEVIFGQMRLDEISWVFSQWYNSNVGVFISLSPKKCSWFIHPIKLIHLPGMCVGSRTCERTSSAAANVWRGRWRGTLRPRGESNTKWRRRAMPCSTHARPSGPRPWITSCRWEAAARFSFFFVYLWAKCVWHHFDHHERLHSESLLGQQQSRCTSKTPETAWLKQRTAQCGSSPDLWLWLSELSLSGEFLWS